MLTQVLMWSGFILFIILMLIFDFKVLNKKQHAVSVRESIKWVLFWISLALVFNIGVYFFKGKTSALEFLTGYLIEYSLSVDNIFVFIIIFEYFAIPPEFRHKVLLWGILGAIIMRGLFIITGVALITKIHWVIYVFGVFLVIIGIKMAFKQDEEIDPGKNPMLKLFRKFIPLTNDFNKGTFFKRESGKLMATPLLVVVFVIETTDIIFAIDSIPAILSVTLDQFIVYTSNIFAILGLRALYFAMAGIMPIFHFLNYGLAVILTFVGVKLLISEFYKIPVGAALAVVGGVLALSILLSVIFPMKEEKDSHSSSAETK